MFRKLFYLWLVAVLALAVGCGDDDSEGDDDNDDDCPGECVSSWACGEYGGTEAAEDPCPTGLICCEGIQECPGDWECVTTGQCADIGGTLAPEYYCDFTAYPDGSCCIPPEES